jgi:hypothetical protein
MKLQDEEALFLAAGLTVAIGALLHVEPDAATKAVLTGLHAMIRIMIACKA